MGFMNVNMISMPAEFLVLPVPLPPMLATLIGHNGSSRWFSLCYLGTKATWSTGWVSSACSYFAAYQPLIEHPSLVPLLAARNLGSDDYPPDDALLCDQQQQQMFVGAYPAVEQFLRAANPAPLVPSAADIAAWQQQVATLDPAALRAAGMFEFLFGPSPAQQQLAGELVAWLDQFISAELIATLRNAAGAGNPYAIYLLKKLAHRATKRPRPETTGPTTAPHE
jgi:hypothetical protein